MDTSSPKSYKLSPIKWQNEHSCCIELEFYVTIARYRFAFATTALWGPVQARRFLAQQCKCVCDDVAFFVLVDIHCFSSCSLFCIAQAQHDPPTHSLLCTISITFEHSDNMRVATLVAAAAAVVNATPIEKRQMTLSANDIAVVQLAHFLENLEYSLYTGGYNNFTSAQYDAAGFPTNFRRSVQLISSVSAAA